MTRTVSRILQTQKNLIAFLSDEFKQKTLPYAPLVAIFCLCLTPTPGTSRGVDSRDKDQEKNKEESLKKSIWDKKITSPRSLVYHSGVTLSSSMVGFLMGTFLGIVLSVGIVYVAALDRTLMPWIIASQTIPILAIAPMVVVVLGSMGIIGLVPKATISTYLCFFPVVVGMVKGLRSPSIILVDLMNSYSASKAEVFWKLRLPASIPYLFASLKVAIALSVVGAIVAELPAGAQGGLGARLLSGSYYGQTNLIWAALITASVISATLVTIVGRMERAVNNRMGLQI